MKRCVTERSVLSAAMAAGFALLLTGCAGGIAREEREPWNQKRWTEMIREDEKRLRGDQAEEALSLVADRIKTLIQLITGDTPFNAAKALLDPSNANARYKAVVYLSNKMYGRREPYTRYYENMVRTDQEGLVRAMALRALNRAREKSLTSLYILALDDKDVAVRLEAAKALANIPDPTAVQKLIRKMNDPEEHLDVRIAAADALRLYRTAEVAQALVGTLRGQFSVAWQARQSLKLMTGQDYRFDRTAWLNYLSGSQRPLG